MIQRKYKMKIDGATQSLTLLTDRQGKTACSVPYTQASVDKTFIDAVKLALKREGISQLQINLMPEDAGILGMRPRCFERAKCLYEQEFVPGSDSEREFAIKGFRREEKDNLNGVKYITNTLIQKLEKSVGKAGVKPVDKLVKYLMGYDKDLETFEEIKKVWNKDKVKTSFKVPEKVLVEACFHYRDPLDEDLDTTHFVKFNSISMSCNL